MNDYKYPLKICPKMTKHHIQLNNLTKMKVKCATQVSIFVHRVKCYEKYFIKYIFCVYL